jgi:hypothetical protein
VQFPDHHVLNLLDVLRKTHGQYIGLQGISFHKQALVPACEKIFLLREGATVFPEKH